MKLGKSSPKYLSNVFANIGRELLKFTRNYCSLNQSSNFSPTPCVASGIEFHYVLIFKKEREKRANS